jgi:hypothetical protein
MFISTAALLSAKVAPLEGPALATSVRLGLYANVTVSVLVWAVVRVGVEQSLLVVGVVDVMAVVLGVEIFGGDAVVSLGDVDDPLAVVDLVLAGRLLVVAVQNPSDPQVATSVQHSCLQHFSPFRQVPPSQQIWTSGR